MEMLTKTVKVVSNIWFHLSFFLLLSSCQDISPKNKNIALEYLVVSCIVPMDKSVDAMLFTTKSITNEKFKDSLLYKYQIFPHEILVSDEIISQIYSLTNSYFDSSLTKETPLLIVRTIFKDSINEGYLNSSTNSLKFLNELKGLFEKNNIQELQLLQEYIHKLEKYKKSPHSP